MKKVLAIIVLYGITPEESITLKTLERAKSNSSSDCCIDILLYDNSPTPLPDDKIKELEVNKNIFYRSDVSNRGIGAAYNYGAELATANGYQWLLLLDQDTTLPDNLLNEYNKWISRNQKINLFVPRLKLTDGLLFSPCAYIHKRGFALDKISSGIHQFDGLSVVNSGILIRLSAFNSVGGYDPNIKLDFADSSFISRFSEYDQFFCVTDAVCIQDFSDYTKDKDKLIPRFIQFCTDAKQCKRENFRDHFDYFILLLRRTTSLTLRTRSFKFIEIFITKYVL